MPTNHLRARSLFLTVNFADKTDEYIDNTKSRLEDLLNGDRVRSAIACREHWSGGGTPHFHLYIQFTTQVTLTPAFKERYGLDRCNIQPCKGSPAQAWGYVAKTGKNAAGEPRVPHNPDWDEEVWYTKGDCPAQGKRTELDAIAEDLHAGADITEIARSHTAQHIKFASGIAKTYAALQSPRALDSVPPCLTLIGPTGTGKSQRVNNYLHSNSITPYVHTAEFGNFWEGYQSQTTVFLEEFRGQITRSSLLRLIDKYEFRLNVKGTSAQCQAEEIFICSPSLPSSWYDWKDNEDLPQQLYRRLISNPESRIFHTGWKQFIDCQGNILYPQPEWGRWNEHESKPMTRDDAVA